jgi:hypothetical protein
MCVEMLKYFIWKGKSIIKMRLSIISFKTVSVAVVAPILKDIAAGLSGSAIAWPARAVPSALESGQLVVLG